jgi:TnpA family transposase
MSRIQYDALSVRNSDMVKTSIKGNLNVLSVQRKTTRAPIVVSLHMASSKDCQYFLKEKEIQKVKSEKNISYHEARRLVSGANDSPVQISFYCEPGQGP